MVCEKSTKTRILLADSHNMVRQGLRKLVECETDFQVVGEADNGVAAVSLAHERKPDVVVTEARLPGLDSVKLIKQLKDSGNSCTVLILTTLENDGQTLELLKAGANGCIFKTAAGDDLARAIRVVRAGQFICDPVVERELLKHASVAVPIAPGFGEKLTPREFEVLKLAAKGLSNQGIADHLCLTEGTVKGYSGHIFNKMGVSSRTEAVMEGLKRGWISLDED